jgi:hypothetical protein
MSTRTTREIVNFHYSFSVMEIGCPLPAGRYEVEVEEEKIEGLSFMAWRSVRTTLWPVEATNGISFALDVDAARLKAAIAADAQRPFPVPALPSIRSVPVATPADRSRQWRDLIVPPVIIPMVIGLGVLAVLCLRPFW